MDILFKNGTVINSKKRCVADVAVEDGKIIKMEPDITPGHNTQVIDCRKLLVLPGAVDAHVHFELPLLIGADDIPYRSADDFFTGTRAAACGGVTTVIDFVSPGEGESLPDALEKRKDVAVKACIDYSLHVGLSRINDAVLSEMEAVRKAGITSFKVFMTYSQRVDDDEFLKVLKRSRELDSLVMVHAESHEELEALREDFVKQGKTDAWYHYLSRPEFVEAKGVERAIELALKAEASLYIVHLACKGGMKAVKNVQDSLKAQGSGQKIYAETCPQYLHFTSEVYKQYDGYKFVCSPAIKGEASREALWEAVKDGSIGAIATDHCPFMLAEKANGADNFTNIPNGVMGTEIFYPYMLSQAGKGIISYERAVELCCFNPSEIFKLSPNKGIIAVGADADIVLYDPNKDSIVSAKNSHGAGDYTIWEGVVLKGYPIQTYSRGKPVFKDGKFIGKRGYGRFLKR